MTENPFVAGQRVRLRPVQTGPGAAPELIDECEHGIVENAGLTHWIWVRLDTGTLWRFHHENIESLPLHRELQSHRERAKLSRPAVTAKMDWGGSKLFRIEHGEVAIGPGDLAALLRIYGIGENTDTWRWLTGEAEKIRRARWSKTRRQPPTDASAVAPGPGSPSPATEPTARR